MKIFSFIGSLLDRLCVVAGAFVGSQVPQFMQQYTQRLAGHVEALQKLINQLRHIASLSSQKTLEQYIEKFQNSSDPDFIHQGDFMQGILNRWEELHLALEHLTSSSIWLRPYYFLKDLQPDIAHSTFASYQPGFNLTLEGVCYAGVGIILGWAFYQMISQCIVFGYTRAMAIFKQSV